MNATPRSSALTRSRDPESLERSPAPLCAQVAGLSLHAGVCVPARDRARLERLCRYVARPPIATDRLSRLPDGDLCYRLRNVWRDGTTHIVLDPLELIDRLVALIQPPRANQVRYHGVLAPCAGHRAAVVPWFRIAQEPDPAHGADLRLDADPGAPCTIRGLDGTDGSPVATALSARGRSAADTGSSSPTHVPTPSATQAASGSTGTPHLDTPRRDPGSQSWAQLMRRVFAIDVLECPACGGRMRVLAAIEDPQVIRAILHCLGLPARAPPLAPSTSRTCRSPTTCEPPDLPATSAAPAARPPSAPGPARAPRPPRPQCLAPLSAPPPGSDRANFTETPLSEREAPLYPAYP